MTAEAGTEAEEQFATVSLFSSVVRSLVTRLLRTQTLIPREGRGRGGVNQLHKSLLPSWDCFYGPKDELRTRF